MLPPKIFSKEKTIDTWEPMNILYLHANEEEIEPN